ncbi:MAG: T9SS type A sorting domain-containing protein [Cryomorphaceae bacterium]
MKTFHTLVLFFLMGSACLAQPVITSENFTGPGTILYLENASPAWFDQQTLTEQDGSEVLWNATNWEGLAETEQTFYAIDAVPNTFQLFFNSTILYPDHVSTHALPIGPEELDLPLPVELSNAFTFYNNTESGYYATGNAFELQGFPVVTQNDSIERIFRFPLTYGDSDSTAISFLTAVPLFGAYGQTGTRHSEVDAWGELATPYGLYNTVRVKAEVDLTDTLYIDQTGTGQTIERPLQTIYYWLSPNVPGPVLEIAVIEDAVVSATMYVDDGVVSVGEDFSPAEIQIFPNPATDYINFDLPGGQPYSISIFDISGKQILQKNNIRDRMDIRELSPGLYIAKFSSREGESFAGKFAVAD